MVSLYLIALLLASSTADPLVTLNHGGQLRGKSFNFDGLNIDLFLGIRYAQAQIGSLRFQKPRPPASWTGIRDVKSATNVCPQISTVTGALIGDEDCLFMDITVPDGVDVTNKKPVMVFIYGGSYTWGSKDTYLGAPLAKHGDVIVVAINYRLNILGFLSEGEGTGNFGLWDQRAALLWVQDNIAQFGGDPDLVTIFGESAGAGSVAAQMMGKNNNELFRRAIQESGSLYNDWSWYQSERERCELVTGIRQRANCTESTYKCLRKLSITQLFEVLPSDDINARAWHPMPDNDFFTPRVLDESYELSQRFDLLSGFNAQEGATYTLSNETVEDGMSEEYVQTMIEKDCKRMTPLTIEFCTALYTQAYGLNTTEDDKERGLRLSYAIGERAYNVDIVRQLVAHSNGATSTYAYQFDENVSPSKHLIPSEPSWLRVSAVHGDELLFVFGSIYIQENNIWEEYFGPQLTDEAENWFPYFNDTTPSDKPLTDLIMTMWTNFAATGNPNQPVSLPTDVPEWPEFNTDTNQFMELNSTTTRVITTPHKDRLDKLTNTLLPLRNKQFVEDKGTKCSASSKLEGEDVVVG